MLFVKLSLAIHQDKSPGIPAMIEIKVPGPAVKPGEHVVNQSGQLVPLEPLLLSRPVSRG